MESCGIVIIEIAVVGQVIPSLIVPMVMVEMKKRKMRWGRKRRRMTKYRTISEKD